MTPPATEMVDGTYNRLSFEDYQATKGLNHSRLETMIPTPAHFRYAMDHPEPDTKPLALGRIIHSAILEPGTVDWQGIVVKPEAMRFSTNEGKKWKREQERDGKTIVDKDEWECLTNGVRNVVSDPVCRQALSEGEAEVSIYWHEGSDRFASIQRKARLDFVPDGLSCIVDLKTVSDARPEEFARSVWKYGWHRKAKWYLNGWNVLHPEDQRTAFVWIALEKKPPFLPAVYQCHPLDLAVGEQQNDELLNDYISCMESGVWPGYTRAVTPQTGVPIVDLGRWIKRKPLPSMA